MNANLFLTLRTGFSNRSACPCFEPPGDAPISYAELEAASARIAGRLHADGVRPGDRVAVQAEKSVEHIMLYMACLRTGAIFTPFNPSYTPAEIAALRSDADPSIFITDPVAYAQGARLSTPMEAVANCADGDLAALIYTSGTTGRSKGAMLTHRNLAANAIALHRLWGFGPEDRLVHALPVFHVHGLFVALHCALLSGCPMVWLPRFTEEGVIEALRRSTVLMGVPTFYSRLLSHPSFDAQLAGGVRLFISGSAPLTESVFAAFEQRTGKRILERYGMSEAVIITSNPLQGERRAGSVGFPLPGVAVRISGGEETGEIEIRGESVFSGYWRMPERTADDFTADGFFRTGDVGRIDSEGRLWISGRAKDLVITGGFNVYPKEVELVLDDAPGVRESAVIGLPHPDFGEGVTAVVIGEADEAALIAACRARLAPYKVPKRIVFVDELPRNAMGKVQKNLLRAAYSGLYAGS